MILRDICIYIYVQHFRSLAGFIFYTVDDDEEAAICGVL